jgi:hypothetical protein
MSKIKMTATELKQKKFHFAPAFEAMMKFLVETSDAEFIYDKKTDDMTMTSRGIKYEAVWMRGGDLKFVKVDALPVAERKRIASQKSRERAAARDRAARRTASR